MDAEEYTIDWDMFLLPYQQATDELYLKFSILQKQYQDRGEYSPIQTIYSRVKTPASILEKAKKHGFTNDQIDYMIKDIAGVRLVTQFEEDITLLYKLIKLRNDMKIVSIKDYLSNPKESGYKSIHLIIEYDVNTINGLMTLLCEIQIRTIAMDFWATIEHSLNYKYKDKMPEDVKTRLVSAANAMNNIDREMGKIRDEITDAQRIFRQKSLVLNSIIENLNKLTHMDQKDKVKKYYKVFTEMRDSGNTVQLSLLKKELEQEIIKLSNE